ncbi:hypothetical protein K503DRAFT_783356 [Rhizopogon vinicolor AM-OR11-026]|uniref:Uncharacterized protein n=1 Tax=Rhizopogon vinicolor AM-OR11-026 TaxID=1314800 RepID=A0A1B7MYX7_9AGAM|nr:hypothetical protein K503DRAFT_783356 [Rhizopogon vinicolor AM-OR11-026]
MNQDFTPPTKIIDEGQHIATIEYTVSQEKPGTPDLSSLVIHTSLSIQDVPRFTVMFRDMHIEDKRQSDPEIPGIGGFRGTFRLVAGAGEIPQTPAGGLWRIRHRHINRLLEMFYVIFPFSTARAVWLCRARRNVAVDIPNLRSRRIMHVSLAHMRRCKLYDGTRLCCDCAEEASDAGDEVVEGMAAGIFEMCKAGWLAVLARLTTTSP